MATAIVTALATTSKYWAPGLAAGVAFLAGHIHGSRKAKPQTAAQAVKAQFDANRAK